uniref:BACON domain-containing protein n=1 Tax=Thermosporothrix sp. COM3 TaxID=2490863 RepID=A0A455SU75_9CHLR|nr:hypothetical protein KTC_52030 [Thermosporothrix sp. COM3]
MGKCLFCNNPCYKHFVVCFDCYMTTHAAEEGTDIAERLTRPVPTVPLPPQPGPFTTEYQTTPCDVVEEPPRMPGGEVTLDEHAATPLPPGRGQPTPHAFPPLSLGQKTLFPGSHPAMQAPPQQTGNPPPGQKKSQFIAYTGPLRARQLPGVRKPATQQPQTGKKKKWVRLVLTCLLLLAMLIIFIDGILVGIAYFQPKKETASGSSVPVLSLSSSKAEYGQQLTISVQNFKPQTRVYLSRDLHEPIKTDTGKSVVKVGDDGKAEARITIDRGWKPGLHAIQAEDIISRFTASAALRIAEGSAQPAIFQLSTRTLDMGLAYEGANTIQMLTLSNGGNGNIIWTVSSDQPWLQATPNQGSFSSSQVIAVGVQRAHLAPGKYTGTLKFTSNVGLPQTVAVSMEVQALPTNPGAVLQATPVVMDYNAFDGNADPKPQTMVISNPGTEPLYWKLNSIISIKTLHSDVIKELHDRDDNWLRLDQTSGTIPPQGSANIPVTVNSKNLVPGTYLSTLVFSVNEGQNAYNSPQSISIALTIQPRCGITAGIGQLSFVTVAGQGNPSNQSITLSPVGSCQEAIDWNATASTNWVTIAPAKGQIKDAANPATPAISITANTFSPGTYYSSIIIRTPQSTLTIAISLRVQAVLTPNSPIMRASPLNVNFAVNQGQPAPPGQTVTITNTGKSPLIWDASVDNQVSWLSASPLKGSIPAGQTGQLLLSVDPSDLTPGTYVGQIVLHGKDTHDKEAGGNPQTITVNFTISPPCSMAQPSQSTIAFSAIQGSANPASRVITFTATGNCSWPLQWQATVSSDAPWLKVTSTDSSLNGTGTTASVNVQPDITGLTPGNYTAQVTLTAQDQDRQTAKGSPQTFQVSLTVLQPCTLQFSATEFAFTQHQGQAVDAQILTLRETGACAYPITWTAKSDSDWLSVTDSGQDSGNGSGITIGIKSTSLAPGSYKGNITISATGNGGATVQGGQSIPVTLTVVGSTVSGVVVACQDGNCTKSSPLAGATVTLSGNGGNYNATADSNGNFILNGVANGSYTLTANGTQDNKRYAVSMNLTVSGDTSSVSLKAVASG